MNRKVLIVGTAIVVPLLIFLALSFGKDPRAIDSPLVDAPAPGFALRDLDGLPVPDKVWDDEPEAAAE